MCKMGPNRENYKDSMDPILGQVNTFDNFFANKIRFSRKTKKSYNRKNIACKNKNLNTFEQHNAYPKRENNLKIFKHR